MRWCKWAPAHLGLVHDITQWVHPRANHSIDLGTVNIIYAPVKLEVLVYEVPYLLQGWLQHLREGNGRSLQPLLKILWVVQ